MRPRPRDVLATALFVGAVGLGFWHQQHRSAARGHVVARVIASGQCGPELAARLHGLPQVRSATWDKAHHQVVYVRRDRPGAQVVTCAADGGTR